MNAERAVDARAGEAEEDAQLGRCLEGGAVSVCWPVQDGACRSAASTLAARDMSMLRVTAYPLWTGSTTVDAAVVLICLCDLTQLGAGLGINLPHFTHLNRVACGLSGREGMRRRGVLSARERSRCRCRRRGDSGRRSGCLGVVCCGAFGSRCCCCCRCCCTVTWYVCECVCMSRVMLLYGERSDRARVTTRDDSSTLALFSSMRPAFRAFAQAPAL